MAQKLYEEARLISNPDLWQEQRAKNIQEKISKERESRIRGSKKAAVKVNRKLAERILEREEKAERRRAQRVLEKGGDDDMLAEGAGAVKAPAVGGEEDIDMDAEPAVTTTTTAPKASVLSDPRFAKLFEDEDFQVDEKSHEFQMVNPSTKLPKGLTAVEQEELESRHGSSDSEEDSDDDDGAQQQRRAAKAKPKKKAADPDANRISSSSYKKAGHNKNGYGPQMVVSSSSAAGKKQYQQKDKTFGARVEKLKDRSSGRGEKKSDTIVVGEREITFAPERAKPRKKSVGFAEGEGGGEGRKEEKKSWKDRRSASGNVFRRM